MPGHLFGPNKERGVYKTTDGGGNWNLVKFIDEDTGFTDIAIDPANTNTLYAASYQRRRMGCCFNGGGPGSALWKTTRRRQELDEADRPACRPAPTDASRSTSPARTPTSSTRRSRPARPASR